MKCPICNADSRVLDTRGVRRRRECFNEHRFTTEEVVVTGLRESEDAAIRDAVGTLQQIAHQFNRSISYVWKVRKGCAS